MRRTRDIYWYRTNIMWNIRTEEKEKNFKKFILKIIVFRVLAHCIATIHLTMIILNLLSVPFVIAYEPFYIWMPVITFLVSPLIGGTYCMFNRMENFCRVRAAMPVIHDRLGNLFSKR